MARGDNSEVFRHMEHIQRLETANSELRKEVSRLDEENANLEREIATFDLLKTLSTTGILRDLELGNDPDVRIRLKNLLLRYLPLEVEG